MNEVVDEILFQVKPEECRKSDDESVVKIFFRPFLKLPSVSPVRCEEFSVNFSILVSSV